MALFGYLKGEMAPIGIDESFASDLTEARVSSCMVCFVWLPWYRFEKREKVNQTWYILTEVL